MKRVGLGRNQLNFDFKAVQKGPMGKAACLSFSGAAEGADSLMEQSPRIAGCKRELQFAGL